VWVQFIVSKIAGWKKLSSVRVVRWRYGKNSNEIFALQYYKHIIFFSAAVGTVTVISIGSRAAVSVIALTPKQFCTYHQQAGRHNRTRRHRRCKTCNATQTVGDTRNLEIICTSDVACKATQNHIVIDTQTWTCIHARRPGYASTTRRTSHQPTSEASPITVVGWLVCACMHIWYHDGYDDS
jgi:hypothetical protein